MSSSAPEPNLQNTPAAGAVHVRDEGDRLTVQLSGEVDDELRLDLDDAAAEVAERRRADARPVEVDARAVTFMDSAGASFLARLAVAARPDRVTIRPSEPVAFLLTVTRLSDVLDIHDIQDIQDVVD